MTAYKKEALASFLFLSMNCVKCVNLAPVFAAIFNLILLNLMRYVYN